MKNKSTRILKERVLTFAKRTLSIAAGCLFILILAMLIYKSGLVLSKFPITELLFSSSWNPEKMKFGFFAALTGTVYVTGISMLIAIPVSLLSAIYIAEYLTKKNRILISSFIDILAGVPSVVFGLCALLVLVPFVSNFLGPFLGVKTTGMCIFTASVTLAIMVYPIIISLAVESLDSIPEELRESTLSLGATKWQMIKKVLLKSASPGILAAVLLGFGRAFGETMAVAMVIGSRTTVPGSLFDAGQTLPSLLVSSFGEMMSIPLERSALIFVALVLLAIVTLTNIIAGTVRKKLKRRWRV